MLFRYNDTDLNLPLIPGVTWDIKPCDPHLLTGTCIYGYLREIDDRYASKGSFYYIGEGSPTRPSSNHDNVMVPPSDLIVVLHDNLSKKRARFIERSLILHYGRIWKNDGILQNIAPGRPPSNEHMRSSFNPPDVITERFKEAAKSCIPCCDDWSWDF